MSRPAHLRPGVVALVGLGGAVGTTARYLLATALPAGDGWPTATFAANLVGAFLLGLLLEALVRRAPENPRSRLVRLALGTGVLGGFTTFSALAIEIERMAAQGTPWLGLTYGLASVVLGFLSALGGVVVAARRVADARAPAATDASAGDSRAGDPSAAGGAS